MRIPEKSNGRIVALHGHHGVGKDSIAAHLVGTQGYVRMAFGDGVYEDVAKFLGVPVATLRERENKEVPQDWMSLFNVEHPGYRSFMLARGEDLYAPRTSRYHLTNYGTDYTNTINPSHWVNQVEDKIATLRGAKVVITDLRSYRDLRELQGLRRISRTKDIPVFVLQVIRAGCVGNGHESDTPLDSCHIDDCVDNVQGLFHVTTQLVDRAISDWFHD